MNLNPPIHTLGVFLRPSTPELKAYFLEFQSLALDLGFNVILDSLSAGMIGMRGLNFEELCMQCDALISIGGDGTLISTARRLSHLVSQFWALIWGIWDSLRIYKKTKWNPFCLILKQEITISQII